MQPTSGAIRASNRARLVAVLRRSGTATRSDLAEQTGLSRATVSSLVNELLREGLVCERRSPGEGFGRPPASIALDRSAGLAIAVDVGVRHVAVAVGDLSRCVLAERWTTLPRGHRAETGTELVLTSIASALCEAGVEAEQVVGAAVSIAAPIARDSGRLLVPDVLPGWNGTELAGAIGRRWNVPVALENDANLGALGEAVHRTSDGGSHLLYVKLASRVGLGIALGSRVYRGRDGYAGELGHVTARPDGAPCWCGRRGCLELEAGGDGMLATLRARGVVVPTVERLVHAARAGQPEVLDVVRDGVRVLARGLADTVLLLNPSAVVLGGELTALGDLVLGPVRAEIGALPFGPPVEVTASALGERASLVGALALVLSESAHFVDRSVAAEPPAPVTPAPPWDQPGRTALPHRSTTSWAAPREVACPPP